jgi:acyl-CoA synthetase (AMP-forming)/AMP-acid ligase II
MDTTIWRSRLPDFAPSPALVDEEIIDVAGRNPSRRAVLEAAGNRRITFGQLADGARRVAAGLAGQGVGRDDVAAIVAVNQPDFFVAMLGSLMTGAAVATANAGLTATELRRQLISTAPKVVFADTHSIAAITEALARTDSDARVYMLDGPAGAQPLSALLRPPVSPPARRDPTDLAFLFPSGGTTGLPKIAAHSHAGATAWLQAFEFTPSVCLSPSDVVAVVAPFTHMFGAAVACHALNAGAAVVAMRTAGFDLEAYLRMLADHRVTVTNATPPVALALARHPMIDRFDLTSLRLVILGAAPTPPEVQDELEARLGCRVADCLGATEAFCYAPATDPVVRGSVGALGRNVTGMLVDPDTHEIVGADTPGELLIRGPQVMVGYHGDQRATAQVLDEDGWLHTGDLCSIDADGNIYILDRLKELIKVGGASVAPAEVERELIAHPAVVDAAVVGRPHPELGEVPVAYVATRERGDENAATQLLNGWLNGRLASWKHPRDVIVVDRVPRTPAGKLARRELIERERGARAPDQSAPPHHRVAQVQDERPHERLVL